MKSSHDDAAMTIGEVAERFGVATHVLRHWEATGLLAPARSTAGRRRYGRDDLYRIAVILRAKDAGFSLDGIRDMLTTSDPAVRRRVLQRHRDTLIDRIARAQASLGIIDCALSCDHDDFTQCAHFRGAVAARIGLVP